LSPLTCMTPCHLFLLHCLLLTCHQLCVRCLPKGCFGNPLPTVFCIDRRDRTFPRGLPEDTKGLHLFENAIRYISVEDFSGLGQLELLDLSQNYISELPAQVFHLLVQLRNLDLSSNMIKEITNGTFTGLRWLERLYLFGNHIRTIQAGAFDGLHHLLELKLHNNQFQVLPPLHLPSLLLLDTGNNPTLRLTDPSFHMDKLETLVLAETDLSSLDEKAQMNLENLHTLDLSFVRLTRMPLFLRTMKSLVVLKLTGNHLIGELKEEDFKGLHSLQRLDISRLGLKTLPEGLFKNLPKLEFLAVTENPFNCICSLVWFPMWLQNGKVLLLSPQNTRCHFPLQHAGKILSQMDHRDFGCPTTTTQVTTTIRTSTTKKEPTIRAPLTQPPVRSSTTEEHLPVAEFLPTTPFQSVTTSPEVHICPQSICLNGGTCQLDSMGQIECTCRQGFSGLYCENNETPVVASTPSLEKETAITAGHTTSTSIEVNLHHYVQVRPNLKGIRLTYRNLSGPDKRPMQLSIPASYPQYTLRGLCANSTYYICASPLGESESKDSCCMEAQTAAPETTMVVSVLAAVLVAIVAMAVTFYCLRKKRAKGHPDLGADPMELEGVKTCMESEALPKKAPEISSGHNNLEFEVPLMQKHGHINNNVSGLKSSYF
uniref:Vasorin a n=1 Tax=Erpetoichthys calabaricus TaxID=27687 RepID=A0A8C4T1R4_ERPCA